MARGEVAEAFVDERSVLIPDRARQLEVLLRLHEVGFRDVDCFWKYFELAIFGGFRPER